MPLQQHHIDELKRIHKEDFGEDLSDDEAWEMGHRLVNFFRLLLSHDRQPTTSGQTLLSRLGKRPPINRRYFDKASANIQSLPLTQELSTEKPPLFAAVFHHSQKHKHNCAWCDLRDQVHAFYRENRSAPTFKQILLEVKKETQDRLREFLKKKVARNRRSTGRLPRDTVLTTAQWCMYCG